MKNGKMTQQNHNPLLHKEIKVCPGQSKPFHDKAILCMLFFARLYLPLAVEGLIFNFNAICPQLISPLVRNTTTSRCSGVSDFSRSLNFTPPSGSANQQSG